MNLLRTFLNIMFCMSLTYMLLDCDFKHKKNLYLLGLFATGVLICDGFVLLNFGYATFMKLYPLLIYVPSFIAFLFISKYKGIKLFFVLLTTGVLTMVPNSVGFVVSSFFSLKAIIINAVCFIMYIPTFFLVYRYFRPSLLYMLRSTDKGWFGFCTIPLSYFAIIYSTGLYNINNVFIKSNLVFMLLSLVLTLAAYVLILRFFKQTREQLTLQSEQNLLKTQVAAAKVHFEALKESQERTILYRHDMRHHLNLIDTYLADNNTSAALNYITEVEATIDGAAVERYCSNYTINLILYSYLLKAKNEQITVETLINLPEKNAVSDMDLCIIFANAIENAVNACKRISSVKDRTLKIVCESKNDQLFIRITNSYAGMVEFVDDMPLSTKENHGLGTKSIAAVAQKYGGVYSFTAEDGGFKTSIII